MERGNGIRPRSHDTCTKLHRYQNITVQTCSHDPGIISCRFGVPFTRCRFDYKILNSDESAQNFAWTDEEVSLLLSTVLDSKTKQTYNGVDWESIETKYVDITESFVKRHPTGELDRNQKRSSQKKEFFPRLKLFERNTELSLTAEEMEGDVWWLHSTIYVQAFGKVHPLLNLLIAE